MQDAIGSTTPVLLLAQRARLLSATLLKPLIQSEDPKAAFFRRVRGSGPTVGGSWTGSGSTVGGSWTGSAVGGSWTGQAHRS